MKCIPNHTNDYKFSIIVPVYNEQENMVALENRLSIFLSHSIYPACVLFVNDESKDDSNSLINDICSRHNDFFYLNFEQNAGLSAAIKAGIDYCQSDFVGYIDADLQTDPDDFNLLLKDIPDFAMVMGIRANRKDSIFKKVQSKIANGFRRMMTNDGMEDTGCPLKVMQTEYAKRVPFFNGMHRFLPALIQLQDGKVKQIAVRHYPRTAGLSKFNLWNRLLSPFLDCFAFRWMKKRYINYKVVDTNI
jgi:dolichol-phosphate mannosyltransferase